jgi:PLP dependent protein
VSHADGSAAARTAELASRLDKVRSRIGAACAAAGRDPSEVTLIAVTKTYPASDVLALAALGVTDFGENRDQEAAPKAAQVAGVLAASGTAAAAGADATEAAGPGDAGTPVTWHFIGQLQSNKAHSVARYADVVHSVDRMRLVRHLGAAACDVAGRNAGGAALTCLVQVSLDADPDRGGVPAERLLEVARAIHAQPGLALGGLMAIAPLGADPATAFAPLRQLSARIRSVWDGAAVVSAGMSGDLEAAVAAGATHLRIGTALLGNRSVPVR